MAGDDVDRIDQCVSLGCTTATDPDQYPTLCHPCRDAVEADLIRGGLMDPDDYAHERGYITDDGEYVEAFDGE